MSVLIIAGMAFYLWRRRRNRFKFKKDEIFDEILDRGHLESEDDMPHTNRLNDSFNEEDSFTDRPSFKNNLTS